MPEGFDSMRQSDIYVPLQPSPNGPGSGFNYSVAARLRKDVTIAQANAEAESVFAAYKAANPAERNSAAKPQPRFLSLPGRPRTAAEAGAAADAHAPWGCCC